MRLRKPQRSDVAQLLLRCLKHDTSDKSPSKRSTAYGNFVLPTFSVNVQFNVNMYGNLEWQKSAFYV